jgi:hypothetical protein
VGKEELGRDVGHRVRYFLGDYFRRAIDFSGETSPSPRLVLEVHIYLTYINTVQYYTSLQQVFP